MMMIYINKKPDVSMRNVLELYELYCVNPKQMGCAVLCSKLQKCGICPPTKKKKKKIFIKLKVMNY